MSSQTRFDIAQALAEGDLSSTPASPDSTPLLRLNPSEPPWYVTRMPGGVGGAAP